LFVGEWGFGIGVLDDDVEKRVDYGGEGEKRGEVGGFWAVLVLGIWDMSLAFIFCYFSILIS
jgi:hypothetical protein